MESFVTILVIVSIGVFKAVALTPEQMSVLSAYESWNYCVEQADMDIDEANEKCRPIKDVGTCSPIVFCMLTEENVITANYTVKANKMFGVVQERLTNLGFDVPDDIAKTSVTKCLSEHDPAVSNDPKTEMTKFIQCAERMDNYVVLNKKVFE